MKVSCLRGVLQLGEGAVVSHHASTCLERAIFQLEGHERLEGRVILAREAGAMRGSETEAGIVVLVAEHHCQPDTLFAAQGEPGLDQCRPPTPRRWCGGATAIGARPTVGEGGDRSPIVTGENRM